MSRHRNVRSMNYKDEYDGYDDVYGHSVEDDSCISPSDADQWLYDRNRGTQHGIDSYLDANKDIPEEDETVDDLPRRDSINLPELSSLDKARLASCLEGIRNVIGDTVPEKIISEIIIKHNFDLTTSLDAVLNSSDAGQRRSSIDTDLKSISKNTKKPMSMKDLMAASSRPSNLFNRFTPQKNINPNNSAKTESTPKFNSLAELTSFHLNNVKKPFPVNKFTVPKFQINKDRSKDKSNELDNFHIDLTRALKTVSTDTNPKFKPEVKKIEEFVPQFIDCDFVDSKQDVLDDCCMNLTHILEYDTRDIKKRRTKFGKTLCGKCRMGYLPKVVHEFDILNNLEPFKFDVPSPDDSVQKFVRR